MQKTRERMGLIVPSSNTVMEVDFYRNLPADITCHTARMFLEETTVAGEEKMLDDHFPPALSDIKTLNPGVVVFGCTSAGALRGNQYERELIDRIEKTAEAASVSVMSAVRSILGEISPERIVVLTPYVEALNERIVRSLRDDNFNVGLIEGMGIDDNFQIGRVEPEEIIKFSRRVLTGKDFDCIFFSCTNFRAWEVLGEINKFFNTPVISSNMAAFYRVMQKFNRSVHWQDVLYYNGSG